MISLCGFDKYEFIAYSFSHNVDFLLTEFAETQALPIVKNVSIGMVRRPSFVMSSVRTPFSKIFFSKTTRPIEAKFHVEPPWIGGTKVCSGNLGHMTKMAAMPIYSKKPSKIFSGTKGPMTLGLGMQHWGLGSIKVCSNDDLGLTLTYFMARSNWSLMLLYGKNC